ncbi:hypothetical protein DF150_09280 [Burkholderia cenocepacia]|nr:hypothetical protein DF150_09280 [Burkholderia cenocepacia]
MPQRVVLHLLPLVIVGRERIGRRGGKRSAGRCPREGDDGDKPDCRRTPPRRQTRYAKDVLRFAHQLPRSRQAWA